MNKLIMTLLAAICLCASSCSIEMNFHIKEDYSGTAEMRVDVSQMISFMMSVDSLSEEQKDSMLLEAMDLDEEFTPEELEKMAAHGLTNLTMGLEDETDLVIRYDFERLNDAYDFFYLNDTSLTEAERAEMLESEAFVIEKDKLVITFKEDGISELLASGMEEESEEGMDMSFMTSLFTFKQTYSFDRKVVAIDDGGLPVRLKDNKVYYATNLAEYLDDFIGREVVVYFTEPGKKKKR